MSATLPAAPHRRARLPFSPWHLVLLPATLVLIFPSAWLIVTSVETPTEALHFPPILIPHTLRFANYADAWHSAPFGRFFVNSGVVAVTTVLSNLVLCSLAGYAFARFRFLGRAGDLPGRTPDRVDAADGGQRDEPRADAGDLLPGAAVLRQVGSGYGAGRDLTATSTAVGQRKDARGRGS